MAFGDVVRFANAPTANPYGIGGDANTIWHAENAGKQVYELSTVDFSTVRNAGTPGACIPYGIGGDANTIWFIDITNNDVHELSTVDFSTVRNANTPQAQGTGIGGDANTIWHCDQTAVDQIYELSTVDLSSVRNAAAPGNIPWGIGGDANTIWHCDEGTDLLYELSTAVGFAVLRGPVAAPDTRAYGIGGDANTIWHIEGGLVDDVYELDAAVAPPAVKTLVQAALISIPPLIVLPILAQILKITGGC